MTREQLAHVLRAVSRITEEPEILIIGSQSILGSYPEDQLPPEVTGSAEVDIAFFCDPDASKAGLADAAIGEFSMFHNEFGYYPQGVSVETGVFPEGWRDRLITYATPSTEPGHALCLEPHDCVLAKLVRYEEKDQDFAQALVKMGLINLDILADRVETIPAHPAVIDNIRHWIHVMKVRYPR